ncbi:hypothetical protein SEA_MOLLYMUR_16 [Gordonia phage Mollymur]|uniref:Uncharacterized protein n=1 Tax=Gordonia phage Mollymur TaxID=2590895 RepID=A0A4Y6EAD0_9CAUD|nr:head scaffolding protein [Gordonia phage Mollymur]QDF15377.1 hypothetical protein SEA_MOLLYMUR_16 [Gordonia phage Mollymur]
MSDTTTAPENQQTQAAEAAAQAAADTAQQNGAGGSGAESGSDEPVASNGKPFAVDGKGKSLGYPAETPWREMEPEEQTAWWMHQAKGWERKAKNPESPDESEELTRLRGELQQLKDSKLTDAQRDQAAALDAAKQAGIDEAEAHYKPLLRNLLLENIATSVIGDVKAKKWAPTVSAEAFRTEAGELDGAAVLAHLREIYGDNSGDQQPTPPVPGTYQQAGQFQPGGKTRPNHLAQSEAQLAKRGFTTS